MIELHYVHTPNVRKIRIMLNETGLAYNLQFYDLRAGDHLSIAFGALNPNRKLPTIRDLDPADGGEPVTVFESGAILIYLAEKTGMFLPRDMRSRAATLQWLMWQMAGLGPMTGQAGHFLVYAPHRVEYAIERYSREVLRLLNVLETQVSRSEYLGADYSIADMACWPLINAVQPLFDVSGFPGIKRWHDVIAARPAVLAAFSEEGLPARLLGNVTEMTADEWSNLHGETLRTASQAGAS